MGRVYCYRFAAYWVVPSGLPKDDLQSELLEFGCRVRRVRNEAGLTQEKLAERALIATRTLQKIEAGKINILVTTARRLKEGLGCDWDELF